LARPPGIHTGAVSALVLQLVSVQSHLSVTVNGLSPRINVIEAASVPGIALRARPVVTVKTSGSSRSVKTTLASASCSSVRLGIQASVLWS